MPKWISIDRAIHKYEVKEEDLCLWAETKAITASFTETTLIIDEESLQKFLRWHETFRTEYKRQNKLFHFHKTFCSEFDIINTKQNVHFTKVVSPIFQFCLSLHQFSIGAKVPFINKRD